MLNDGTWQCLECGTKAKVEGRNLTLYLLPSLHPQWPIRGHTECQLAQDIDHIDFSKLKKIG